jgi:hypothetical protein
MKTLKNNLVVVVILSVMLSSTASANPLNDLIKGHLNEATKLIDLFNKSSDETDSLSARVQNAIDGKNAGVYSELRSLTETLNQRFKDNGITLVKLQGLKDSDCALALADTSKSAESLEAIDTCYELRDALGAATDARGATAQGLDLLNNALSKYVALLEGLDAAKAKAAEEKAAAEEKKVQEEKAAAEAKAAAAKATAAKAAATKKTTITCVKGKLIKKVTAVKPKCPTGYKLKK